MPTGHPVKIVSKFHKAAREYAATGWPVFPCAPGTKHPLAGSNGLNEATTDIAQIDKWWTEHPDANIAFTPHAVGLGVVDLDGDAGLDAWFKLDLDHKFPVTRTVTTPRGGQHLYFMGEIPTSAWAPDRKRCLGEHIDTRGPGSYALLPPSLTEHGEYRLTADVEPAPVPEWVCKRLERTVEPRKAKGVEIDSPANVARCQLMLKRYVKRGHVAVEGEGGGNRTYHVACEVLDAGLTPEKALELLTEPGGWNSHCVPPWQSDELQTIVENAASYQQNEPGSKVPKSGAETFKHVVGKGAEKGVTKISGLAIYDADQIDFERIEWLWLNRIPSATLNLLAGHGDVGKTSVLLDLAARCTRGGQWPDGADVGEPITVLYLSSEDSPHKVLKPRFEAAGGDSKRFKIIKTVVDGEDGERRTLNISKDLEKLSDAVEHYTKLGHRIGMLIMDPISSYFGKTDTWRNTEVRTALEPVVEWAEHHGITVIGNTHLSKARGGTANSRVLDSTAITATARSVHMVGEDPDDPKARLFIRSKGNLGPAMSGLRFHFDVVALRNSQTGVPVLIEGQPLMATRLKWDKESVTLTAAEMIRASDNPGGDKRESSKTRTMANDMTQLLKGKGWQPARAIQGKLRTMGHAFGGETASIFSRARALARVDSEQRDQLHWWCLEDERGDGIEAANDDVPTGAASGDRMDW